MRKIDKKTLMIIGILYTTIVITTLALLILLLTVSNQANTLISVKNGNSEILATFLTLGTLAYTFGLRHAVDADHIAAVDNVTRKLMQEGKDSKFVGTFFSLGHSSVVIFVTILIVLVSRFFTTNNINNLENIGGIAGTLISGGFLYLLAILNFFVLKDLWKQYKSARDKGGLDEEELNALLLQRGFMTRYFNKFFKLINTQWHMYFVGVLFGIGFDTASEVALLAISATLAGTFLQIPLYMLLIFPLLFTVGMVLIDTTDGLFMTYAYQWAFDNPLKKLWYNITMTGISVLIAYVVGTLELITLIMGELNLSGPLGSLIGGFASSNWPTILGVVIIGTFALCWIVSFFIYKFKIRNSLVVTPHLND